MLGVRVMLSWLLGIALVGGISAQPWEPALEKEDGAALDAALSSLGTTYRAEPVLAAYLSARQNPAFVATLLQKGANPNLKGPKSGLSPLALAITRSLDPRIVSLLVQAGAALDAKIPGISGNIIEAALDRREYVAAGWLVKANWRALPRERLALNDQYKDFAPFLLDDLVAVRNVLRYGNLDNTLIWNLTLAGNSRKVAQYLLELQVDAHLNSPGNADENGVGLDLLAANPDLLGALLAQGLTPDQVDFDRLYLRAFSDRSLESVRALKALDPAVRPELFRPSLAAGLDFLRATTGNLVDLGKPEVLQGPDGLVLLTGIYEQSDFSTVLPLVQAANSEAVTLGLYRYAFGRKDEALVRNLVAFEAPRIRPELYFEAIQENLEGFKALTHDLADLKNPALYQSAQQPGRDALTTILLRTPQNGRTLLERIYEKTDFATVLGLIQPLDPPRDLLVGRTFWPAYQEWLTRGNKDIVAFGFETLGVRATIQGDQIAVTLPGATDPSSLVAAFRLSGGVATVLGVPQVSGKTANDFSRPVVYEVTARDGTKKAYTVTVTVPSPPPTPESATPAAP